ncbi:dihydropteroate synthase [Achromobacter sp. GG226]|uniref:dihydropteroate synthase n=1 Tax=Verticiella alkaliphila TaxID=2779529 RepID=UPI001C0DC430|nr:dihydropteroate synthase [Verticiella sp. GG226]MBU4609891.1 dihydropteroate synthase [Verticiella sp. GG226]
MLLCGRFTLPVHAPLVMGIINATPDSFSDGGRFFAPQAAIAHGRALVAQGAHILDIGGESTRPGADTVPDDEEIARVVPVIRGLQDAGVPLSVDTRKPVVMRAALAAGADMLNDVNGFRDPQAQAAAAAHPHCALVVMHMHGEPGTMQVAPPDYADVVAEVRDWLAQRCNALRAAGVAPERLVLDPGLGFGKTVAQNYRLLARLDALAALGYPVLAGLSRKSMIGAVTGRSVDERLAGSLAGALAAVVHGATLLRVHDVAATVDALAVWREVSASQEG